MNKYTKGECGCYIEYYEGFKDKPDHIIYCPKHKSAPDLYEALKEITTIEQSNVPYDKYDVLGAINIAKKALAKADGK